MVPWEQESTLKPKSFLKKDWSVEEAAFKANHQVFIEGIACANNVTLDVEKEIEKEIGTIESQTVTEVPSIDASTQCEIKKEEHQAFVESGPVGDKTAPSNAPTEPKESSVPSTDPFDEVFASTTPQPPKFPEPAAKPVVKPVVVAEFKAEETTVVEIKPNQAEKAKKPTKGAAPVEESALALDGKPASILAGLSLDQFSQVDVIINRVLTNITKMDLDAIQSSLADYAVELTLDHYRENPRNIDEKIAEIKKNQDGIQSVRRQLFPLHDKLKIAWEYASKVGIMCSNASSAEKRLGQIMIHCEEIYLRYSQAKSVLEQCEKEYEHLQSQYEACSRLVSFYTAMNPRDMPNGYSAPGPRQSHLSTPTPAAANDSPPWDVDDPALVGEKDEKFQPRPPDELPKTNTANVSSLENFNEKPKQALQTSPARGTRSVDF